MHAACDLITLFNECFALQYNTRLLRGGEEPLYLPANEESNYNTLFFAHGYFSSALHECAHWLIAGEARRKLVDYGYWYAADGRTKEQQDIFQCVEVKPQAIEWILSVASNYKFHISCDNLSNEPCAEAIKDFKKAVYLQVLHYCKKGLSSRTQLFRHALCVFYEQPMRLDASSFSLDAL